MGRRKERWDPRCSTDSSSDLRLSFLNAGCDPRWGWVTECGESGIFGTQMADVWKNQKYNELKMLWAVISHVALSSLLTASVWAQVRCPLHCACHCTPQLHCFPCACHCILQPHCFHCACHCTLKSHYLKHLSSGSRLLCLTNCSVFFSLTMHTKFSFFIEASWFNYRKKDF